MMRLTLLLLFGFLFCLQGTTQSVSFGFLFRPGVTVGGEYIGDADIDNGSIGVNKYRLQATIPLKTKLGVDLKKLDLKSSQTFITVNSSLRQPRWTNESIDVVTPPVYTQSVGFTTISAGLRQGIWLYSAQLYFSESSQSIHSPLPNVMAYGAKIKLNNLKFIYFYGAGAAYNFGRPLVVPIGGFTTKLHRRIRITAVLPVQMTLQYKLKKQSFLQAGTIFSGYNPLYRNEKSVLNLAQLKHYVGASFPVQKHFWVSMQGGICAPRRALLMSSEPLVQTSVGVSPYAQLEVQYRFGKSLFDMQLDGID